MKFIIILFLIFIKNSNSVLYFTSNKSQFINNNENELFIHKNKNEGKYYPNWESLNSRPLPKWYDEEKIGIFVNWGVYSVPSFGSEWFWKNWKTGVKIYKEFMKENYPPNFTYQDFASEFTAEFFNPDLWADLFVKSGAKYVVLSSKHHEGFTLWPSKHSFSWNSMDLGPKRDILGEVEKSIRSKTKLKFGLYHSLFEWFNPLWEIDFNNNFTTIDFVNFKTLPELYEIVDKYKPEIIWSDGEWDAPDDYWKSKEFLTWLYNESPVKSNVVVNDRWGKGSLCKNGGFLTCSDRFNPGKVQNRKWENCLTLDKKSWGFRRNADLEDYLTPKELITILVETISCGGNFLINVGPSKDGIIAPIMQERLLQMGNWLEINGEAIYYSKSWENISKDSFTPGIWYTYKEEDKKLFAVTTKEKPYKEIILGSLDFNLIENICLLGSPNLNIKWEKRKEIGTKLILPQLDQNKSNWAWAFLIKLK